MSDITNIQSHSGADALGTGPAATGTTAQTGKEGGKSLPPSSSLEPTVPQNQTERAEDLHQAVTQMNDYLQVNQRDLQFSIDQELGETVVKVVDRATEEVIRQIPDEIFLKLARRLQPDEPVHFLNEQA